MRPSLDLPRRAHLLCCGLLLSAALPAREADPEPTANARLAQFGFESWTTEKGLAGNWVTDIAETPDGFLWIATSGGLSRFDGTTFRNYRADSEPELPSNLINALALGPDGRLWLGLETGGVRVFSEGRIAADPRFASSALSAVHSLAFDDQQVLWIGTRRGLFRAAGSDIELVAPSPAARSAEIQSVRPARTGGIWVRTREHGIWRIQEDAIRTVADAPECAGFDIAEERDGTLRTLCSLNVWQRAPDSTAWRRIASDAISSRLLVDRDAAVWYASEGGLIRLAGGTVDTLPPSSGLGDHRVRALLEDSRGDLWIGTFSGGLARIRRGVALAVGAPEGLPIRGTTAVLGASDGTLWLGSYKGEIFRWQPDRGLIGRWGAREGLSAGAIWALAEDPSRPGRVFVGDAAGLGAFENGRLHPLDRSGRAVRFLEAEVGRLWVGRDAGGLDERRADGVRRHDARNGLALDRVYAMLRDGAGRLFAGGDRGLFRLEGDRWLPIDLGVEGPVLVRALAASPDEALWVATDVGGLVRVRGGSTLRFGEREGLPFNLIFSLQVDSSGGLWLSGNDGLLRLLIDDFDRWARKELRSLPIQYFGRRDGLRERECNGWGSPTSSRLAGGQVVYPTLDGIALIDPGRLPEPELVSTEVFLDGAWSGSRALSVSGPLRLGADERHVRLRFGAIELERPETVTFRHRLEGVRGDWVQTRAATEAEFAYLPPGSYRFRLQARLPGKEWVEAGTSLPIVVRPRVWESDAFRLFVVALTAGAALALFGWRTRIERRHGFVILKERALLRDVIDTSPFPIFAKARDFSYALVNRAAAAVFGLRPAELVGRGDSEVAERARGMSAVDQLDREVLERGEERTLGDAKVVDATGATKWYRVVKRPRRTDAGEVDLIVGTAIDVTDFKLAEEKLRRQQAELRASREELRRLARELLRAQEEERRRLARELHDDLVQRIAGLAMLVGGLARAVERERASDLALRLEQLGKELERLAADTQALSRDLHPYLLENLGLADALRAECATFAERTGLAIPFASSGDLPVLAPEVGLALYRIAQEALRNALEHARTSRVRVAMEANADELRLVVSDEGAGFAEREARMGPGLGLASMAERARLIGARLEVRSALGQGTRVAVHLPLAGDRRHEVAASEA